VLFCNAGIIGKRGSALGSFDYASWEELLRVNVLGAAAFAEAFADHVAASKRKVIAMMSSRLGSIAESSGITLPYATSKAALNMLVKGLAANLAAKQVIVVALSPGWVRTDMGGAGAPLGPEDSVAGLRKIIAGLKIKTAAASFPTTGHPSHGKGTNCQAPRHRRARRWQAGRDRRAHPAARGRRRRLLDLAGADQAAAA